MGRTEWKTAVCIATFRRPEGLLRVLESLESQGVDKVVVADNDPDRSGRSVLDREWTFRIEYTHCPERGVAAVRNAAIRLVANEVDAILMIDDDEWAATGWRDSLVNTAIQSGSDVVGGPTRPRHSSTAPRWILRTGVFDRTPRIRGGHVTWVSAGNMLIRSSALLAVGDPWFDEILGRTGGEDSDFVQRIIRSGGSCTWDPNAVVHEEVPSERERIRWVFSRGIQQGNVSARRLLRVWPRSLVGVAGLVRILLGCVAFPVAFVSPRGIGGSFLLHVPKGVGMIALAFGAPARMDYGND